MRRPSIWALQAVLMLDCRSNAEEVEPIVAAQPRIFMPEEIPGYDCDEDSREYVIPREQHRIRLP